MMAANETSPLLVEHQGLVTIIKLNRPSKLNTLNNTLIAALSKKLNEFELDDTVRVIIITGVGRAFSAGADIHEFQPYIHAGPNSSIINFMRPGHQLTRQIETYPKPIIAAVNGLAYGGGCELVESIHLAIAADTAQFSKSEINIGIIPTFGGTQRLPRNVGRKAATELILTGRAFGAEEAARLGLVNRVVHENDVLPVAVALGETLAQKPVAAISAALNTIHRGMDASIDDGLAIEQAAFRSIVESQDIMEGIDAFVEKRNPRFVGLRASRI
jgi:enoyl-CoA hydratase